MSVEHDSKEWRVDCFVAAVTSIQDGRSFFNALVPADFDGTYAYVPVDLRAVR